jgi:hypothetical protein
LKQLCFLHAFQIVLKRDMTGAINRHILKQSVKDLQFKLTWQQIWNYCHKEWTFAIRIQIVGTAMRLTALSAGRHIPPGRFPAGTYNKM